VHTGFWWGNLRERDHLEDIGVDGGDNTEMDLLVVGWEHRLDLSGSEQRQVVGSCECGNEPQEFHKTWVIS